MNNLRASVLIPCFNEAETITSCIERILDASQLAGEILVLVDSESDTTIAPAKELASKYDCIRVLVNSYGRGPANAIRYGLDNATADVVVVTMADGSDDPQLIDDLVRLVERGVAVASASRYSRGGQLIGPRTLKSILSRLAGISLQLLASVGTYDATNSFKAYSRKFVKEVGIDARDGFEIGLEMVTKAHRLRAPVAELPTIWLDRTIGKSNFKLGKWLPKYLHWYFFAFGPKITIEQLRQKKEN